MNPKKKLKMMNSIPTNNHRSASAPVICMIPSPELPLGRESRGGWVAHRRQHSGGFTAKPQLAYGLLTGLVTMAIVTVRDRIGRKSFTRTIEISNGVWRA